MEPALQELAWDGSVVDVVLEDHAADVVEALGEDSPGKFGTDGPGEADEDALFFYAEEAAAGAEVEYV
jgi:hypothetical protein